MSPTLDLRAVGSMGTITGILGGKLLNCLVRPAVSGSPIVAGLYHVHSPVQDIFYGPIALMAPAGVAVTPGGVTNKQFQPGGVSSKFESPGVGAIKYRYAEGVSSKVESPGGVSSKLELLSGVTGGVRAFNYSKFEYGGVSSKISDPSMRSASAVAFVLSSRPVPGLHCLVIQNNFADLIDALRIAGGATIRVF